MPPVHVKKGGDRLLWNQEPDYQGVGKAINYPGPSFDANGTMRQQNFTKILTSQNSSTAIEIIGQAYYDSNSMYRDIIARPMQFGVSIAFPDNKQLYQMKVGDTMVVRDEFGFERILTLTSVQVSASTATLRIRNDEGREFTLVNGKRVNNAPSDDPNYKNWYVGFTQTDIRNIGQTDLRYTTKLMIYCDDVQNWMGGESRMKSGGKIRLVPGILDGEVDGELIDINRVHTSIHSDSGLTLTLGLPGDLKTKGGTVTGAFVKLSSEQSDFF